MSAPPWSAPQSSTTSLADIDVMILAGGLGTRLRSVLPDRPKVLAPIRPPDASNDSGNPPPVYLDILLRWLARFGARRIIMALGYRADQVTAHLDVHAPDGLVIDTVVEPEPLGTAGAIRLAAEAVRSDPCLVLNGDSYVAADLRAYLAAFRDSGAIGGLLATRVPDASRFGTLEIDGQSRLTRFLEKQTDRTGPGMINAGVYAFSARFLDRLRALPGKSLEHDIFPALPTGSLFVNQTEGHFIDIGTPSELAAAHAFFAGLDLIPSGSVSNKRHDR